MGRNVHGLTDSQSKLVRKANRLGPAWEISPPAVGKAPRYIKKKLRTKSDPDHQNQLHIQQVDDSLVFEPGNHKDLIDHEDGDREGSQATISDPISSIIAVKDSLKHAQRESPIEAGVSAKEVQI